MLPLAWLLALVTQYVWKCKIDGNITSKLVMFGIFKANLAVISKIRSLEKQYKILDPLVNDVIKILCKKLNKKGLEKNCPLWNTPFFATALLLYFSSP